MKNIRGRVSRNIRATVMRRSFTLVLLLLTYAWYSCWGQAVITLRSLLDEMTNYESVVRWPTVPYQTKQASSYDRRSVSPDKPGWFANQDFDQFIQREQRQGRTEYVMMDAEGPGAIVRFWLTTVVKPGTLRFYFDNEERPSIVIPAFDLMRAGFHLGPALLNPHSSYEPNGKGGNTLYLPLPYQKHCKVTWEYADTTGKKTAHYYQINYRTYPPGTKVRTFTKNDLITEKQAIQRAENRLWQPPQDNGGTKISRQQKLSAGRAVSIALPKGAAAIRSLAITLAAPDTLAYAKAWRATILKIEFDGEQTVWCPLGDFFGSGYGGKPVKSWYRELTGQGLGISRWLMPYQKTAKITLVNQADFDVNIDLAASVGPFDWDNRTLYFHTTYKYEAGVKDVKGDYDVNKISKLDTAGPIDWNFATITGKGLYLGNTLAVYNHMPAWYGEGDAKAYVDNESFPSEFGTGLEDYYNTSWAPVVLYQTPFANAPRADNPSSFGHNTFTRTRNLDGIAFTSSFRYDMEMISWTGGTIDAAATVYWYGMKGAKDNVHND